jgi:hypothetical protein
MTPLTIRSIIAVSASRSSSIALGLSAVRKSWQPAIAPATASAAASDAARPRAPVILAKSRVCKVRISKSG